MPPEDYTPLDGAPSDPRSRVPDLAAFNGAIEAAVADQEEAKRLARVRSAATEQGAYFQALFQTGMPLELAAIMVREMATIYWNLELRR